MIHLWVSLRLQLCLPACYLASTWAPGFPCHHLLPSSQPWCALSSSSCSIQYLSCSWASESIQWMICLGHSHLFPVWVSIYHKHHIPFCTPDLKWYQSGTKVNMISLCWKLNADRIYPRIYDMAILSSIQSYPSQSKAYITSDEIHIIHPIPLCLIQAHWFPTHPIPSHLLSTDSIGINPSTFTIILTHPVPMHQSQLIQSQCELYVMCISKSNLTFFHSKY